MTVKKIMFILVVVLSIYGFSFGIASAQNGYCTDVTVVQAGATSTGKVVYLQNTNAGTCGTWTNKATLLWFVLDDTAGNGSAMLASALSAQAQGLKVTIVPKNLASNGTYTNYGTLSQITVQK